MRNRVIEILAKLSGRSDLVIAILMLVAVVMMLIPLPTFLVDIMITANIAASVLILLVSFYVARPLDFSALPSVILVSTLFRLAITITTTRLILLQADAGQLITAFGSFVVGGSIAVGLVVFLIITIAQFIVVAKGSERVAEVAARFTLDALPGKQMSIDAELRNGDIDQAEARRMRQQLERESQLFGAMDGAMKFVKGDVIASIVIILVNLIGGFAVGTLQHGMSLAQAAATYSLLTVGDGLVAQIPALLIAVAAGTTVTRVASADGQDNLGRQISTQLLQDARALALAAVIMLALALVPGFPSLAFVAIGAGFGAAAYSIHRRAATTQTQAQAHEVLVTAEATEQKALSGNATGSDIRALQSSYRIIVRVGPGLGRTVTEPEFALHADRIRREFSSDLGVDLPAIAFHVDENLPAQRILIDLEGAPIVETEIPANRLLVEEDRTNLDLLAVAYDEAPPVMAGHPPAVWVEERQGPALDGAGIGFLTPAQICASWTAQALRLYAGHFVGIQEARRLLSDMEDDYADLVREAQQILPLQKIAEVLRRLVAENVPIRNLRLILEALVEWGPREPDAALLTERVRNALRRQISFRVADRNNMIAAYVLQRSAEDVLRANIQKNASGSFLDLSDEAVQTLATQIEQALATTSSNAIPVVLTAADVRRHMRNLLSHHGYNLPVLSYEELGPEFNIQPLATITVERKPRGGARETSQLPAAETADMRAASR